MGIPLVIGVTGHRALRTQDAPLLRAAVREALCALRERCPHTQLRMLNSLASGADTLCAQVAAELGIPLDCPLPLPLEDYRKDFDGDDLACFDSLLAGAETVFVAPPAEKAPSSPPRSQRTEWRSRPPRPPRPHVAKRAPRAGCPARRSKG